MAENDRHSWLPARVILLACLLPVSAPLAQGRSGAADEPPAMAIDKVEPATAGLGDTLRVTIKNWPKDKPAPKDWVLYLDGVALPGVHPDNSDARDGTLRFYLQRDDRSKAAWAALLRGWAFERPVDVAVGPESGADKSVAPLTAGFQLRVVPRWQFWGYILLLIVLVGILLLLGSRSNLLRDSDTFPPGRQRPPFSLGRVQMAFWLVLVWASYLYIGLVTWDYAHSMTTTALVLMGISAATGFGAVLIDSDKQRQVQALQAENTALPGQINQLQQTVTAAAAAAPANPAAAANLTALNNDLQRQQTRLNEVTALLAQQLPATTLASGGVLDDLLRDANGISLHRFQIVVWTLTLGAVFVGAVIVNLAMPEFDPTLLALMGISSGTYLGFKFPERKA
jgi:hypothetical protein